MIKRPLNPRFSSAVLEGRKFTTIRSKPWPCWKPIMLYNWSGAAYRSKQVDVAAVEVEEVLELIVTHDRDGGIVFGRDKIDGIPIHKTEGFADAGEMQEWFAKVVPIGKTVELALMRFRLLNVKEQATGDEYKATRERLGMTQSALAAALDLSRKAINQREQGGTITREAAMALELLALRSPKKPRKAKG